ncbi:MAG: hypothetical protein ACFFDW_04590 [Candidatus Thorarchaeota archaeon]
MSDDHELFKKMVDRGERLRNKETIYLPKDCSSKAQVIKEIFIEIERNEESLKRQDMIEYRFNFPCVTQATSLILGIVMFINSFVFISSFNPLGRSYILSMTMLVQGGIMLILSGVMIPRKKMSVPRRYHYKNIDSRRRNLGFAFTHSLTWFICSLCMLIFSTIFYFH